jgi:F0F1-type ATP synthase assembly protein I
MTPGGGRTPSGAELLGVGVSLAAAVVVPLVLGVVLDGALRTGPILTLVGLSLGIVAAIATGYVRFKRFL